MVHEEATSHSSVSVYYTHLHMGMVFFAIQSVRNLVEATEVVTSGGAIFHLKQYQMHETAAPLLT